MKPSVKCRKRSAAILFSDNCPQFLSCEFKQFAKDYGFEHITSSPHYPQSKGEVELAVQTLKAILNKMNDEYLGLLSYRNTPLKNGYSPAQLNMGRRLKCKFRVTRMNSNHVLQTPILSGKRRKSIGNRCR